MYHFSNMQVTVLLFGPLTDITGSNSITLEAVSDTRELVAALNRRFPALAGASYLVAVDKQVVTENTPLAQNNIIALLPPFSGG
jgi:molybdopterin converting factor small subunit